MRKEELLMELCLEVADKGIHTERFTELWLESGITLEGLELEVVNRLIRRGESEHPEKTTRTYH